MRVISARDFNQDTAGAKRAASVEPVVILDRGQPSHVLISIVHYKALLNSSSNIVDLIGMPGIEDIPFDLPPKDRAAARPAEFG
jgi:hypothetical protein